jgi:ketosteroid isomerase-like protein
MRKFLVTLALSLAANASFCQQEENGIIYIKHPNIDAVHKTTKAYLQKDMATLKSLYSDTAKWWASGMQRNIPIAEAMKLWMTDFDMFDSINIRQTGYPDYLHYKDQDAKVVQSWWTMSGKSKKTGEVIRIPIFQLDDFNSDGKIVHESIYGDFSKWNAAGGSDNAKLKAEIQELETAWSRADNNRDVKTLAAFYSDDAVSMNNNQPMLVGHAAIKEDLESSIAKRAKGATVSYDVLDVYSSGNFVTEVGKTTRKDANGKVIKTGKYMAIWEKRNGKWVCIRDIANDDAKEK